MTDLKMSLIENALDFAEFGLDQLEASKENDKRLKYAILHLSAAVELFLKQRLVDINPELIITERDDTGKVTRTIYLDDALKKLKEKNLITNNQKRRLSKIKHIRNTIV